MKLEIKIIIGLLAVVAVALIVIAVRGTGRQQVEIVAPGEKPVTMEEVKKILSDTKADLAAEIALATDFETKIKQTQAAIAKEKESNPTGPEVSVLNETLKQYEEGKALHVSIQQIHRDLIEKLLKAHPQLR